MLGLIRNDVDTNFRKRDVDAKEVDTINQHVGDQRELHVDEDEKP